MADNDLKVLDNSTTPVLFVPATKDRVKSGVTVKENQVGMFDGSDETRGARADAAWDGSALQPTEMAIFKAIYALLVAQNGYVDGIEGLGTAQANALTNILAKLTADPALGAKQDALLARLPSSIGRKVSTNSLSVALASDEALLNLLGLVNTAQVFQPLTAAGATGYAKFRREVSMQITGTATSVSVQMQRSTQDPAGTPNWCPVDDPVTGNPATGIFPVSYRETAVGWWRANLLTINSGNAIISIDGGAA